uniref:Uncharacterized protein n=1 Tax=Bracon brevicornis TaxID=1563983 RepID=A0A6V7KMZ1_9HYME
MATTQIRIAPEDLQAMANFQRTIIRSPKEFVSTIPEFDGSNYPATSFITYCNTVKEQYPNQEHERYTLSFPINRLKNPALKYAPVANSRWEINSLASFKDILRLKKQQMFG